MLPEYDGDMKTSYATEPKHSDIIVDIVDLNNIRAFGGGGAMRVQCNTEASQILDYVLGRSPLDRSCSAKVRPIQMLERKTSCSSLYHSPLTKAIIISKVQT
jgi:hypothetical protein